MKTNKWVLVAFLCAIFVIYTIDRSLLGILAVDIQRETGLSNVRFGVLSAAIFWTYSLCVPFSGLAGDRFSRMRLIGFATIAWSVMTVLAGFSNGFWSLLALASVAVCVPQTLYGPSASALIAQYHDKTRTVALSFYQAAYYTGWFLSGVAVAAVCGFFGSWRAAFFAFGSSGFVLGVAFLIWSRKSDETASVSAKSAKPRLSESLQAYFGCPTALLVSLCYVAEVFVGFGYSSWGPKFIAQKFSLSSAQAGTGVMFWHYASAFAAILAAGALTDRFVRRWPRFRMAISATALILSMPALVGFGFASSLAVVWASAAWLGAMIGVVGANQFTLIFDVVPSRFRSGAVGFLNVIAGLVGSSAPIALGALSERLGVRGFELGFAAMACVQFVGFLALVSAALFTFEKDRLCE